MEERICAGRFSFLSVFFAFWDNGSANFPECISFMTEKGENTLGHSADMEGIRLVV